MQNANMLSSRDGGSGASGGISGFLSGGVKPVAVLFGIYFILSIAIRVSLPNSLTLDEAEQSLNSQFWLLGYGPQPPFYNWVQNLFVGALDISLLSLALPRFGMLFLVYLFMGLAARELQVSRSFAGLAMLSLTLLPQVSFMPQQDLTHTIALLMATSLFFYGLCRTLVRPDWQGYAIIGIAIGIGTISKYNFVILPAATIVAVALDRDWRARLLDPRMLLAAVICIAIVLPHAVWLLGNLDLATRGTLGKMVESDAPQGIFRVTKALGSLLVACLAFGALAVVVLALAFKSSVKRAVRAGDRWTTLFGRIMLFSLVGVVAVVLVAGTTRITERWLDPYLLALPLYLLLKFDRAGADLGLGFKRLVPVFLVIMVVVLVPGPAKVLTAGLLGPPGRINMPFADLAKQIRTEDRPATILALGMHLSGNIRMQFPDVPVFDIDSASVKRAMRDLAPPVLVIEADGDGAVVEPKLDAAMLESATGLSATDFRTRLVPYHRAPDRNMGFRYLWLR